MGDEMQRRLHAHTHSERIQDRMLTKGELYRGLFIFALAVTLADAVLLFLFGFGGN